MWISVHGEADRFHRDDVVCTASASLRLNTGMRNFPRLRTDLVCLAIAPLLALSIALSRPALASADADADAEDACGCNTTPNHCDANCSCDPECAVDWTIDECAAPNACEPASMMDDAELEALEEGAAMQAAIVEEPALSETVEAGSIFGDSELEGTTSQKTHGCSASAVKLGRASPWTALLLWVPVAALGTFRRARRRLALAILLLASCGGPADMTVPSSAPAAETARPAGNDDAIDTFGQGLIPACNLGRNPPLVFMYAGLGSKSLDFLRGCPGEVVAGEKNELGPRGPYATAEAKRAGGRTAFVLADFGRKIRDLLKRPNGVARTNKYLRDKLAAGYDYIVIDEITADPDWADGAQVNRLFRQLLLRLPPRKVIAYISLDLTKYPGGDARMRERKQLLRALATSGKAMALELYLHTGEVMSGAAPRTFSTGADRLQNAVRGLRGAEHINRRAVTVIGLSMASRYPQYRYLDQPRNDLASISKQVSAIRRGSARLREQNGVGYYFVGTYDIRPPASAPYTFDSLVERLRVLAGSWRR